jgi:hypothetical protein
VASDDDTFLGRWSRRKHAARRGEPLPEPAPAENEKPAAPTASAPPPAAAVRADAAAPELPPIESLKGLESEYREFLRPGVDPATRSAALKKLFGDPHFNQMDGLDVYIDDYSKAETLPAAMLRVLNQARSLGLFEEEKNEAKRPEGDARPAPAQPSTAAIEPPEAPVDPTEAPTDVPAKPTGA